MHLRQLPFPHSVKWTACLNPLLIDLFRREVGHGIFALLCLQRSYGREQQANGYGRGPKGKHLSSMSVLCPDAHFLCYRMSSRRQKLLRRKIPDHVAADNVIAAAPVQVDSFPLSLPP